MDRAMCDINKKKLDADEKERDKFRSELIPE